jgi:glycosyltransferase involved in cell wall biosynthesis
VNIALLTTYPHGGAGVAARRLQTVLEQKGHTATLLLNSGGAWRHYAERLAFLPHERDASVRFSFSLSNFGQNLAQHPAIQQADLIHLHWINQGFLSLRNIRQLADTGKPIVWTLHDMWPFTGGCHHNRGCEGFKAQCGHCPYLRRPSAGDLSHRIWQRKQHYFPEKMHIVACSAWLAGLARESSLFKQYPISSIPNPIDTNIYTPANARTRQDFRAQLGVAPNAKLLLFAAMNLGNPYKGFGYFKEALAALKTRYPDLPVAIVTVGKSQSGALDGLPYPVFDQRLIANPTDMRMLYAGVDVFVTPSLEENLPNTIMESMACGTPVVAFRVGGIPEMITDSQHGKIVDFKNSTQMADHLAWVLADEARRQQLGLAAREKAVATYAQEVVVGRYEGLYQQIDSIKPR